MKSSNENFLHSITFVSQVLFIKEYQLNHVETAKDSSFRIDFILFLEVALVKNGHEALVLETEFALQF